jgi:hypothetical protein
MTPIIVGILAASLVALGLLIGFFIGRLSLASTIVRLDSNQRLARECMHEAFKGRDEFRDRMWESEAVVSGLLEERRELVAELLRRDPECAEWRSN